METVWSTSYSVLINGEPKGFIKLSRGIWQRDPLYSYIFLLCAEGQSSMLRQATKTNQMQGILSCRGGIRISPPICGWQPLILPKQHFRNVSTSSTSFPNMKKPLGKPLIDKKKTLFFSHNKPRSEGGYSDNARCTNYDKMWTMLRALYGGW